jgi:hypothetical protein
MNERIRELSEQARVWAEVSYKNQNNQFTSHWDTPIGYTPSQFFEQKFAELIVLEMCQVINADCESQYSEGITTNLGGLNQARELIKQHFGVEE